MLTISVRLCFRLGNCRRADDASLPALGVRGLLEENAGAEVSQLPAPLVHVPMPQASVAHPRVLGNRAGEVPAQMRLGDRKKKRPPRPFTVR